MGFWQGCVIGLHSSGTIALECVSGALPNEVESSEL